jgi:hypothetical protein
VIWCTNTTVYKLTSYCHLNVYLKNFFLICLTETFPWLPLWLPGYKTEEWAFAGWGSPQGCSLTSIRTRSSPFNPSLPSSIKELEHTSQGRLGLPGLDNSCPLWLVLPWALKASLRGRMGSLGAHTGLLFFRSQLRRSSQENPGFRNSNFAAAFIPWGILCIFVGGNCLWSPQHATWSV